uniref:E3 ubiquitin-protein ligase UBR3 isoform X3 n=1 Tax=Myxine glutinosa TaxID=7769 RepID=UPI003590070B
MAHELLSRGKASTAAMLKVECGRAQGHGPQLLDDCLDVVLGPDKEVDDRDVVEWSRALLAGGESFEEFTRTLRSYDDASVCGLVWTANFVAYRCRTCGVSPCMSLCADCFSAGDHSGHDFNMFRSQAGGACDCGDNSVMREGGFCHRHGRKGCQSAPTVPQDLLLLPALVLPRLVYTLLRHLRDEYLPSGLLSESESPNPVQKAEKLLILLEELTKMGDAMRSVVTEVLTNRQSYQDLNSHSELQNNSGKVRWDWSYAKYQSVLESTRLHSTFPSHEVLALGCTTATDQNATLKHDCLLEELLFWTVKYEFPQKMVTLLLNMLPHQDYKVAFIKTFVQHYSFVMHTLMHSHEADTLSNRIVHISVQLFSSEELVAQVLDECHLLEIMVHILLGMVTTCLLKDESGCVLVVNCAEPVLKNNTYWPLVSDFINVLSHPSVSQRFLQDRTLVRTWMCFLSFFQGMNLNKREMTEHVEFESQTYYAAFAAELEACAQPMCGLLAHCKTPETSEYTRTVVHLCLEALQYWFKVIKFVDEPPSNQLTFHIPLHRYFSMFLSQAVRSQQFDLDSLLPDQELLAKLMAHPLQIQACLSEIHSNMWVRNGLQIKGQAMTYVQSHFCNSMIDPDIYLLQVCASKLDPDFFISSVFERYKVVDLLTIASKHQNAVLDPEHERPMLEGALTFLVVLLGVRLHLGVADDEILHSEMVSQLCMGDKTHSSLLDLIPENPNPKSGVSLGTGYFEKVLSAVADFRAPVFEPGGSMQQGMYTPKSAVWDVEFDPVSVILRAVYRRDMQSAMDRYTAFLKQSSRFDGNPWPPYRERPPLHPQYQGLLRLLHCKTMHIVLFTLLYKILMDHQNLSDHVLCMVLYLLEMGVDSSTESESTREEPDTEDQCYDSWFPSSSLLNNLHHVISFVRVRVAHDAPEVARQVTPEPNSTEQTAQVFSLVAERRRKFQEMINKNSEAAAAAGVFRRHSGSRPHSGQARSFGAPMLLPQQLVTAVLEIRESMLSLLVKLHHKLSGKQDSYPGPDADRLAPLTHGDGLIVIERILQKAARRSCQNEQSLEEICYKVTPPVPPRKNSPGGSLDKEERRRRARERQKKLLAEFASRQKSFMETAMEITDPNSVATEEDGTTMETLGVEEALFVEKLYDCVICGQQTASTEQRPVGLVVLQQATSVLGHRREGDTRIHLPTSDDEQLYQDGTCSSFYDVLLSTLQKHFLDSTCLQSVSIGWEGGVFVQTCGHTVHLDCHKAYMESLKNDQALPTYALEKGEFTCPLCRQLSNSVLPCCWAQSAHRLPTPTSIAMCRSLQELAQEVQTKQETLGDFPTGSNLTKEMEAVQKSIRKVTPHKFTEYSKTPGSPDNDFLFLHSVARVNLELEIVHRGGSLVTRGAASAPRRSCFSQLFNILALGIRCYRIDMAYNPWVHLTQTRLGADMMSSKVEQFPVPLLFRDPCSLLLLLVLTMPQPLDKDLFGCILQVLFTLVHTQALATLSLCMGPEDRAAWSSSTCTQQDTWTPEVPVLQKHLSKVIGALSTGCLYPDNGCTQSDGTSQGMWSQLSIELAVRKSCLPFLRVAALLQHYLYGDDMPSCQSADEEFAVLAVYLVLLEVPRSSDEDCHNLTGHCLHWVASSDELLGQWCFEVTTFAAGNAADARTLLSMQCKAWAEPHLLQLPVSYNTIFQHYHRRPCHACSKVPKDPALCLVCGAFVCLKGACCKQQNCYECVQHTQLCGAGTGIFLLVNASVVIIIRGPEFCLWGSVYLDAHGEEDRDLRRGKPLFLCEERYRVLEQQWLIHSYDHVNKRWGPHYNGL